MTFFQINEQKDWRREGRMAGRQLHQIFSALLIRDSFSSLLWLQLNLFSRDVAYPDQGAEKKVAINFKKKRSE